MKLKFLSLFLALGMFVLGTSVNAQQDMKAPATHTTETAATAVDSGIPIYCSSTPITKWSAVQTALGAILVLDSVLSTGCTDLNNELKAKSGITEATVKKCAAALKDEKALPQVSQMITSVLSGTCATLCTGPFTGSCNTCSNPQIQSLCGGLCCNFGYTSSTLFQSCMKGFPGGSCGSFINATSAQ